jgi:uncharacterized membrane protein YhaH (DUF805 family)
MFGLHKYRIGRVPYFVLTPITFFMPTFTLKLLLIGGITTSRVNDIGWPRAPFAVAMFAIVFGSFYGSIHHIKPMLMIVGGVMTILFIVLSTVRGRDGENEYTRLISSRRPKVVPEAEVFS